MEAMERLRADADSLGIDPDIGDLVEGAGFWIRVLARIIDIVVHNVVAFVFMIGIFFVAVIVVTLMGMPVELLVEKLQSRTLKRQRLGDRWAKTMVVKRRDLEGIMSIHSGCRFVVGFLVAAAVDGVIFGLGAILTLVG